MVEIRAAMVRELRDRTGFGIMDCKKALVEVNGDFGQAIEYLRVKGLSAAERKAGRVTTEGLVLAYVEPKKKAGALVEVNCETDFVSKNADFKRFVQTVAKLVAEENPIDTDALAAIKFTYDKTVEETLKAMVTSFGENITISRFIRFETNGTGVVDCYIHEDALTEGKIGVLLEIAVTHADTLASPDFTAFVKNLLLHIAAARPVYVQREEVPSDILERVKSIYETKAISEGKSEDLAKKIVQGGIDQFLNKVCFLQQSFVKDNAKTVARLLQEINTMFSGEHISIVRFACFEKGEGHAKKHDDVATEVQRLI
jgi:elongation factor Ts